MRSRTSQARALFRIVSAQSSTSSTASSSASAAARSTRSAAASKKRRSTETIGSGKGGDGHKTIFINASPPPPGTASHQSVISGLDPVHPPTSSLANVATQSFFALHRPLLEHQVVSTSTSTSDRPSVQASSAEASVRSTIADARDAIMEVASQASLLSPEQLARTVFVINGESNGSSPHRMSWPKKVAALEHGRFIKLVDNLSKAGKGQKAVETEATALEEEEGNRKDIESAVANAAERGEDTRLAASLGSEADLVILGEPGGPNPSWPRGVASFLAERTRALEPPGPPLREGESGLERAMERIEIEELARHFSGSENAFTMQNMSEDDPNLLLSHAMVQATLPARLQWDGVVAKMDSATGKERKAQPVDVSALNADLLQAEEKTSLADEVQMDSVRRKRRKKMRKHKYRKFRKATRVERTRLKK